MLPILAARYLPLLRLLATECKLCIALLLVASTQCHCLVESFKPDFTFEYQGAISILHCLQQVLP